MTFAGLRNGSMEPGGLRSLAAVEVVSHCCEMVSPSAPYNVVHLAGRGCEGPQTSLGWDSCGNSNTIGLQPHIVDGKNSHGGHGGHGLIKECLGGHA